MRKFHSYGSVAIGLFGAVTIGMCTSIPAHADDSDSVIGGTVAAADANSAAISSQIADPDTIVIKDATASRTYRFASVTPAHGKLAAAETAAGGEVASDLVVTDESGNVLGGYDAPWAFDADNHPVLASYRIEGSDLIETIKITDGTRFPVTFNRPLYSAVTSDGPVSDGSDAELVAASSGKITVPSNYVYNPRKGTLHDYCTSAPDTWGKADFRGPCARHDLCYGKKGDHKKACDAVLLSQLTHNCKYAYGSWNPLRYECVSTASVYYGAVTSFGDDH
ncbi:phospholipase A2 [Streptomyces echinatus]|uniref:phospholipase A2 n=1 Tax=Streptomyces echinatus TaxID=67293 RepID=UPI0037AA2650